MAVLNKAISIFLLSGLMAIEALSNDFSLDFSDAFAEESSAVELMDMEMSEESYQDDLNALFDNESDPIDTTGWCNTKINTIWFDYRRMSDTVKIALIDSESDRQFTFPCTGTVTSQFGPRRGFWHYGMDTRLQTGDPVLCAFNGKVRVIQNDRKGYGNVVVIRHHNGLETLYGHLSDVLVTVDQEVRSGEPIGLGGNTGRSTGAHLHFETRYCGEPFDPRKIIDFSNYSLLSDTLVLTKSTFNYLTPIRSTVYYKVRKGDTLGKIARKYRTSVRALCALNGMSTRAVLRVGKKIIVKRSSQPTITTTLPATNTKATTITTVSDATETGT
jgi:murein DD-endopeptidase MepM/ murein hydrolase activator NlpD